MDRALQQARLAHAAGDLARRDAALAQAATMGRVLAVALLAPPGSTLHWSEPAHRFEAMHVQASPAALLPALAVALLANDRHALRALLMPGVFAAAQASGLGLAHAPCWTQLADLLANTSLGGRHAQGAREACEQAINATTDTALDPDARHALLLPLAALLDALARQDAAALPALLLDAFERHRAFYADPTRDGLTLGMAAWELSACARLAQQRFAIDLAPLRGFPALCEHVEPAPRTQLRLSLPRRTVPNARQAGWQADIDGVPRPTRQAHTAEGAVQITATGSFGIDQWQADFALDASAPGLSSDALLTASDILARQLDGTPSDDAQERAWQTHLLAEALAALDAALVAPDAQSLDRERLLARRAVYVGLLALHAGVPEVDARRQALAMAEAIKTQVQPLLEALAHDPNGAVLQTLRPRPADAALAFTPTHAAAFSEAAERMWAAGPRLPAATPGSRVVCHVAPAGMLADDNELSRHFPGGYRALAADLQPQRVWVAWKVIAPGATDGMAYDGLVWLDDHWAWFPKPFRWLKG
ncbi:Imm49 family immunity protein [Variovorax rhizosphaerae]|uniref:Imm49 family immunity protein n=1 Tax=Variovorax rhizosphaerae TaxID=1836200 RepID=A0ABU8WTW4_9BURK